MKDIYQQFYLYIQSSFMKEEKNKLSDFIWKHYKHRISFYISTIVPVGDPDFEDLLQEIMMKIYNNLHTFNPLHSFKAWIYKIARHHCLDYIKSKKKRFHSTRGLQMDEISENKTPEKIIIQNDLLKKIHQYVNSLNATDREISYLRFYENLRYSNIGKIMGMNINTVKSRVRTIKHRLKAQLEI